MAAEYVKVEDLDFKYDDNTHPTITQIKKYVKSANRLLSGFLGSESMTDTFGNIKEAGIDLVDIKIHNRKVKDGVPGYQYYQKFEINDSIKAKLLTESFSNYGSFTHDPTTSSF